MAVKGAGGRGMSGGGKSRIKDSSAAGPVNVPAAPGKTRTRRSTDAGRETEAHFAGDTQSVNRGPVGRAQ